MGEHGSREDSAEPRPANSAPEVQSPLPSPRPLPSSTGLEPEKISVDGFEKTLVVGSKPDLKGKSKEVIAESDPPNKQQNPAPEVSQDGYGPEEALASGVQSAPKISTVQETEFEEDLYGASPRLPVAGPSTSTSQAQQPPPITGPTTSRQATGSSGSSPITPADTTPKGLKNRRRPPSLNLTQTTPRASRSTSLPAQPPVEQPQPDPAPAPAPAPAPSPSPYPAAPIFIPLPTDDPRLAPYYDGASPKPGESTTDVIVRDQIRRCEITLGRPLTEQEAEIIRDAWRGAGHKKAPSETSEPTVVLKATPFVSGYVEEGSVSDSTGGSGGGGRVPKPPRVVPAQRRFAFEEEEEDDLENVAVPATRLAARAAAGAGHRGVKNGAGKSTTAVQQPVPVLGRAGSDLESDEGLKMEEEDDDLENVMTRPGVGGGGGGGDPSKPREQKGKSKSDDSNRRKLGLEDVEVPDPMTEAPVRPSISEYMREWQEFQRLSGASAEERIETLERDVLYMQGRLENLQGFVETLKEERKERDKNKKPWELYGADEADRQPGDGTHQRHEGVTRPSGWALLALAVGVWILSEAMLHSKRLTDGYGPYVNGGFNGLGSVLVFGSWPKFIAFMVGFAFLATPARPRRGR